MIIQDMPNLNPMGINYFATKLEPNLITLPTVDTIPDFCFCDFECEYRECVFGLTSGGTDRTNDKNLFLYKLLLSADTATIKLFKNDVEIETITDNTFGQYFDKGLVPNATGEQLLYVLFIIDWASVLAVHGIGTYQIQTKLNIAGVDYQNNSHKFWLNNYTDTNANGTFKVRALQNGNILSSQFDFTNLNLTFQTRIKGFFGNQEPQFETDNYLDSQRRTQQIQDQIFSNYTMRTRMIPKGIYDLLIFNNLLANNVEVTDYNVWNPLVYKAINVYPEEVSESNYYSQSQKGNFLITFTDKKRDGIKRNVQ